jgi:hypothetical protein
MKSDYQLLKNTYTLTEKFRGVQSSSNIGGGLSGHRSGYNFPGTYSSNVYGWTPVGDVNFVYNDPYYNSYLQYSSNTNSKFILSLYNMALNYSNNPSEEEKKSMKRYIENIHTVVPCISSDCKTFVYGYIQKANIDKVVSNKTNLYNFYNDLTRILNKYSPEIRNNEEIQSRNFGVL